MTDLDPYADDDELDRLAYQAAVDDTDIGLDPLDDQPEPSTALNAHRETVRHLGTGLASCRPAKPAH